MATELRHQLQVYLDDVRRIYERHGAQSPFKLSLERKARDSDLRKAEKALAQPLDAALAALWSITSGSSGAPLLHDGELLCSYALIAPTQAILERELYRKRAHDYDEHEDKDRDERVGRGWYSEGWLPFAEIEGGGVQLLIDHRPLGSGKPGQVIRYRHDPDEIDFVATSLLDLLPVSLRAIQQDPDEFLCIF